MLRRLTAQSTWLLFGRLATQLGLAICTILLARQLGNAAFGEYAFIASVVVVGNVLTTFGTDMHLIREIAAGEDEGMLAPALWLQLTLSVLFITVVLAAVALLPALSSDGKVAMRISVLSLLPMAFFTVYTTALRGRQRMQAYSLLNISLVALQILAVVAVIRLHGGLVLISIALLAVQCGAALVAAGIARIRIATLPSPSAAPRQLVALLKASVSIAALGIIGIAYQRLSLLLLPSLAGSAATGLFSAAARLVEAAKLGHIAAFTALYPMMAQLRSSPRSEFARLFRLPLWGLLGLALLGAVLLYFVAVPLVALLYGPGYAASASLVRLLAWVLVPYTVNSFLSLALLARDRALPILRGLILATISLGALTFFLVPRMGPAGAAVAALSAEVIQSIVLLFHYARLMTPQAASPPSAYEVSIEV